MPVCLDFSSILSFFLSYPPMLFSLCLASNPPNPSWASFMKMQIHSRAGENVNRRKLPRSTNQKRRTIKNRQQQPGDPNSVLPPPEIATHACINPLQAKNMWLKELCCHLLRGTTRLPQKSAIYYGLFTQCAIWRTAAKYCILIYILKSFAFSILDPFMVLCLHLYFSLSIPP